MRHTAWTAIASAAVLATACAPDRASAPEVAKPAFTISDGAHAGNAHFFFLPPLVPKPAFSGAFDATRTPVIRITQGATVVTELAASISADESYQAEWHTNKAGLDPSKTYRISVLVSGSVLGFADVDVVASGSELKNVNTGEFIALKDGATLPIKFRIEVGALSVGWRLLAAPGIGPTNNSYHSAHAPDLQAVFYASDPDFISNGQLWRFDLTTDTWTQLAAANWPNGKYRNLIYDAPNHRLLTYWDGLGQVYSIPVTGGTWTPLGSAPNSEEYYEGYAFLNPVSGRLTEFAGYGFGTLKDQWWEWDTGLNAWLNIPQGSPHPEPRFGHGPSTVAVDAAGHRAFLGQRSLGATPGGYDDLWVVDLATYSWTNLIPPNTGADGRIGSGLAYAPSQHRLYRFSGVGLNDSPGVSFSPRAELLWTDVNAATPAWTALPYSSGPSGRLAEGFYYDAPRNRLIMVGGIDGVDWPNDVWAYYLP